MSSDLFVVDQEPYHLLHTQNTPPPPPLPSMMNMYDDNSETQFLYYPFSSDIDTVLLDHDIEPPPPTPQMIPISTSTQTTTTVQLSSCSIDESSNHASTTFISNSNSSNSNSPPSIQLETLSLRQQHDQHFHFTNQLPNTSSDFPHQFTTGDYSQSHEKRKTEETPLQILGFDSPNFNTCGSTSNNRNSNNPTSWFLHLGNGGVDSVCSYGEEKIRQSSSSSSNNAAIMKYLQRSFSYGHYSNYINEVDHEHGSSSSLFQTNFINPILESGIQIEGSSLTDTNTKGFDQVSGQIRRVFSTGDLVQVAADQNTKCINGQKTAVATVCSSSLRNDGMMSSYIEEGGGNFKVGKYSAEERRERIDRYRAKRSQRNFNKTIKYACRKTLADNRPRIRGRFARNDETGDVVISKPNSSSSYLNNTYGYGYDQDEDDHLWVDGLHREVEEEEEEEKRVIDGCIGGDGGGDGRNRRMMFETQSDHQHQQKLYNYQYYNNCGC